MDGLQADLKSRQKYTPFHFSSLYSMSKQFGNGYDIPVRTRTRLFMLQLFLFKRTSLIGALCC